MYRRSYGGVLTDNTALIAVDTIVYQFKIVAAIPASKLGIGIPFEGKFWKQGFNTPADSACYNANDAQCFPGVTCWCRDSYGNIMNQYYYHTSHQWRSDDKAAYLTGDATFPYISYENQRSLTEKLVYMKNQGLGGTIIWELVKGYRSDQQPGLKDCLLKSVKSAALNPSMIISSTIATNWNLVSVPNVVRNFASSSVWPSGSGITSGPIGYDAVYSFPNQVQNGAAYWVKYSAGATKNDTGSKITSLCIPVNSGWNMIGSLSRSLATSKITSSPASLVISKYYAYSGGVYSATTSLDPGIGYWVKTSAAGTLGLDTASTANNPPSSSNEQPPCIPGTAPSAPTSLVVSRVHACEGLYHPTLT
ncbi:MAG: hypothetical protein E6K56_08210, partial [Ignavibacteria bacterium]